MTPTAYVSDRYVKANIQIFILKSVGYMLTKLSLHSHQRKHNVINLYNIRTYHRALEKRKNGSTYIIRVVADWAQTTKEV